MYLEITPIENKNINLGIEILRVILCFWVLCFHCLKKKKINYFLFFITKKKYFHVPCFAFISFYFSNIIFFSGITIKQKKRLERLLIPYIIWPLIFFIIDNILFQDKKISVYDLKIQLICGRQFSIPLWYLFSMLFLTILFMIISILFKNYFLFILQSLCIISYIMQYSHYYNVFDEFKDNIKFSILDTINVLPLSVLGLIFSTFHIVEIFKAYQKKVLFSSYLLLYILFKYDIFINLGGYGGIIHIFSSVSFFMGFYFLPLKNLHQYIQRIIKQFTSYTNGIYCLHTRINHLFKIRFSFSGTLKSSIIIYLVSYFFDCISF